jgi:predicted nucleic acid-binding protein/plasmid stability protein
MAMASMVIRNIPDDVLKRFKERAKTDGKSAEHLAREAIAEKAQPSREDAWGENRCDPCEVEARGHGDLEKTLGRGAGRASQSILASGSRCHMIIGASAAVPWILDTPFSKCARSIRPSVAAAPALLLLETANALLKYTRLFALPAAHVQQAVVNLKQVLTVLVPDEELLEHGIKISAAHNHKIYDCLYLALALQRREPLATADRRLAALAKKLDIKTQLIEPSL